MRSIKQRCFQWPRVMFKMVFETFLKPIPWWLRVSVCALTFLSGFAAGVNSLGVFWLGGCELSTDWAVVWCGSSTERFADVGYDRGDLGIVPRPSTRLPTRRDGMRRLMAAQHRQAHILIEELAKKPTDRTTSTLVRVSRRPTFTPCFTSPSLHFFSNSLSAVVSSGRFRGNAAARIPLWLT